MPAGFDYCDEHGITPDVFVCLTDGYTDFGQAQHYPVVWCISSDIEAPHGENIHFEMA
jgi:predicted metal-dependent peptidase